MFLRLAALLIVVLFFSAAVFVFEAASATARALELCANAQLSDSAPVRARLLDRAERTLTQSWARPIAWHAGASEVLSALYLTKARANGDPALYRLSVTYAVNTVRLGPVAPHAWTRLAVLAEQGYQNPLCSVEACLRMSWRVAPMIDPDTGCVRLQIAYRHNMITQNDPRIEAYLRSGVSRRDGARCLSFLPPQTLFDTLMRDALATP